MVVAFGRHASRRGTAGVGCVAFATVAPIASAATAAATSQALPNPQETILVGEPTTIDWVDVWGTIWSPQFGKGGRI